MADYCTQCSIEHFGKDYGDMRGLQSPLYTLYKMYVLVLCEGCGATQVDHKGKCIHHENGDCDPYVEYAARGYVPKGYALDRDWETKY